MRYRLTPTLATCALVARGTARGRCLASTSATLTGKRDMLSEMVSYVTDVEGDWQHWQRFCELSDVLEGEGLSMRVRPGCHLVFGGDSVDKNTGDLRFLRSLLALKQRQPEQVHLVLGNRDINKMRFHAELDGAHWLPAGRHPGVYWRAGAGPHGADETPATFLAAERERGPNPGP